MSFVTIKVWVGLGGNTTVIQHQLTAFPGYVEVRTYVMYYVTQSAYIYVYVYELRTSHIPANGNMLG